MQGGIRLIDDILMKTRLWTAVTLSVAAALSLHAANNGETKKERTFQALVVAERVTRDSASTIGKSDAGFLVYDGGYIEGGDAIGGDRVPTAAAVAAGIESALQTRQIGVDNARDAASPSVVLTYHWGVLRKRNWHDVSLSHLNSNLKARLSLVARYNTVRELEQYILADRAMHGSSRAVLEQPTYQDARQYAEDPRYFMVVTAYDFNALKSEHATPLWRVKMSALENVGYMAEAVPALAAASGAYFGQDLDRVEATRVPAHFTPSSTASTPPSFALTSDETHGLDQKYMGQLLQRERTEFTGDEQVEWDETHWGQK